MSWAQLLTDKSVSPSAFPCQALQHKPPGAGTPGHGAGHMGAQTALLFPQIIPPLHWHHTGLLPTWKRPSQAMGTHATQEMLFPSLSVPGKQWGWTDASAYWLINAINISKASSENQYSVFKELLLLITGFSMSRDTGRNR